MPEKPYRESSPWIVYAWAIPIALLAIAIIDGSMGEKVYKAGVYGVLADFDGLIGGLIATLVALWAAKTAWAGVQAQIKTQEISARLAHLQANIEADIATQERLIEGLFQWEYWLLHFAACRTVQKLKDTITTLRAPYFVALNGCETHSFHFMRLAFPTLKAGELHEVHEAYVAFMRKVATLGPAAPEEEIEKTLRPLRKASQILKGYNDVLSGSIQAQEAEVRELVARLKAASLG